MWPVQAVALAVALSADCSAASCALQQVAPVLQQLVLSLGAEPFLPWTAVQPVLFAQSAYCPPMIP